MSVLLGAPFKRADVVNGGAQVRRDAASKAVESSVEFPRVAGQSVGLVHSALSFLGVSRPAILEL